MSIKTRLTSLLQTSMIATIALAPCLSMADEPEITVYKEGKVPLKKPELKLRQIPAYSLNSQVFDFPTGLRILMQSDRSHPIVTVHTIYNHGSAHDFPGREGLAHFVEHTWFKSAHEYVEPVTGRTDVVPKMKIMDLQGYIGATMNASTWADLTDYMTTASSEFKDLLMQYESWRIAEPYAEIQEEEIKVEVNVILNEWRRRNEQNLALFSDFAPLVIYPEGHPYAHSSTKETLDAITFDDLKKYFDMYYKPDQATIVFIGDFDPIEASSLIFRNFDWKLLDPELDPEQDRWIAPKPGIENPDENNPDHWLVGAFTPESRGKPASERDRYEFVKMEEIKPRIDPKPDTSALPDLPPREVLVEKLPIKNDLAMAVWAMPGGYREDNDALQLVGALANIVIDWGMEPKPWQIDPFPELEFWGCGAWPSALNTMFFCGVEFDPDQTSAENALDKVVNQMHIMWDPTQMVYLRGAFQRASLDSMRETLFNVDQVANPFGGRAAEIGLTLHYTGNPRVHSQKIQNANTISIEQVSELAEKYLKRDRYGMLHFKPLKDSEKDTKADGSAYAGAAGEDEVIPDGEGLAEKFDHDRVAGSWVKPKLDGIKDVKFENGLRVIALQHGEVPLVGATLVVNGGTNLQPENVWDFYRDHIRVEYFDALPIAGGEQYPTNVRWSRARGWLPGFEDADFEGVMYTAPSPNLDGVLYGLREWADGVKPDMDGLQTWIKQGRKRTIKSWGTQGWHLGDIERKHVYPNHPYSRPITLDDWEQFGEWGRPKVQEIIDTRMRPEEATLIIVGNLPVDDMMQNAYNIFSSWEGKGQKGEILGATSPDMPTEKPRVVLADDKGVTQSTIRGRCRLNYEGPSDREAVSVLSSVVGNDVFSTIRVKEGLAYSPGGYAFELDKGSALLGFQILATNAGVGRVVEYMNEWVVGHEKGFDDNTVLAHKLRIARESGVQAQSIDQLTGRLLETVMADQSWDDLLGTGDRIADVTSDQLTRLLKGCSEHMIVTIAGPKAVIEPLLKERDIEYEVLDWKGRRDEIYETQFPSGFVKWKKEQKKEQAKTKKKLTKECAKDPESDACDDLEVLLEEEREEKEEERKKAEEGGSQLKARRD